MACVSAAGPTSADDRLVDAVKRRDAPAVESLIRARIDVNALEGDRTTALHWAVQADDIQTAAALIKAGARVTVTNRRGVTPLMLASTNGSASMIDALLKAGASPNEVSPEGETVLMTAARTGNPKARCQAHTRRHLRPHTYADGHEGLFHQSFRFD
jgi:ankyrin repeat protein